MIFDNSDLEFLPEILVYKIWFKDQKLNTS
jgi:hypothetical protein